MTEESQHNEPIHEGNQFKKILKHGFWYLFSSLSTKVIQLLLLPVYTRYLSPADYGVLGSLTSITQLLPVFISLYMDSSFDRYYFLEKSISRERIRSLYSTHFWFVGIWGLFVTTIFFVVAPRTVQPLLHIPFAPYIPLVGLAALFNQVANFGLIYLRSNLKAKKLNIVNLIGFLLNSSLTLLLLVSFRWGIVANLVGNFALATFLLIYYLMMAKGESLLVFKIDFAIVKRSLIYSIPLLPNIIGGWIAGLSDRLIMAFYGKITQVGLYSIAVQMALSLYLVNEAVTNVQGPISMSAMTANKEAGKAQISEFISYYLLIILFAYLAVTMFSKEMFVLLTGSDYHQAYSLVGIIALNHVFSGFYRVFSNVLAMNQKMWIISVAAILQALSNLTLNLIFIPHFAQYAAAWAGVGGMAIYTACIIIGSQIYDPVPINKPVVFTLICWAGVIVGFYLCLDIYWHLNDYLNFALKLGLLAAYFIPLFVLSQMKDSRDHLQLLFRKSLVKLVGLYGK